MPAGDRQQSLRPPGTLLIWAIPLVLSFCGLVMIASLSLRNSMAGGNPYGPPLRQFQFFGVGLTLMVCCALSSPDFFRRHSSMLWLISVILLCGTLTRLGVRVGGARRWLNVFGARFQPLEFLLFTLPIFLSDRLATVNRQGYQAFLRPTLAMVLVSVIPLVFQPNLGGAILIVAICFLMHAESRGWKFPAIGGVLAVVAVMGLIAVAPYRMRRFEAFWNPWEDPTNKGFQIIQGLVAFANGNVTGVGIGRGLQEEEYLPEAETDYIFPAIGEEFGLVGTLFLLSLYGIWTFRVYLLYCRARDPFLALLTLGLAASVICPMFLNIGGVTKLMPLTGVPLPFISAGGSSMVFMWMKVGLLIAINRAVHNQNMQG
ncbi:MAG: FtsW/RodA/SpoVE family cell cycle protein [Fretibacterium sp.]|nr:FtsW/RodA/SpoVE family cell cycle protein [Fretibacterium sp.]